MSNGTRRVRCIYCDGREPPSYVYVMGPRSDGACKIGYAAKPVKRRAEISRQMAERIELVFRKEVCCQWRAMRVETAAQDLVSNRWTGRGEWYRVDIVEAAYAIEQGARAAQ